MFNLKKAVTLTIFLLSFAVMVSVDASTVLNANITADNAFAIYLSNDDSLLGTLVGQVGGPNNDFETYWANSYSFTSGAISGPKAYLHIIGWNWGGPAGVLGDFSLSNSQYHFVNGSQSLLTSVNPVDWKVYTDAWNGIVGTLHSYGSNGVAPWGYHSAINPARSGCGHRMVIQPDCKPGFFRQKS